jgi:hypothetical protein
LVVKSNMPKFLPNALAAIKAAAAAPVAPVAMKTADAVPVGTPTAVAAIDVGEAGAEVSAFEHRCCSRGDVHAIHVWPFAA